MERGTLHDQMFIVYKDRLLLTLKEDGHAEIG